MATFSIQSDRIRFAVDTRHNTWELIDKHTGVRWTNRPGGASWVCVHSTVKGKLKRTPLPVTKVSLHDDGLSCRFATHKGKAARFAVVFRVSDDMLRAFVMPDAGAPMPTLELFATGLSGTAQQRCEALIPCRMGLLFPADNDTPFERAFGTYEYEGCHMAMAGLMQAGGSILATWGDPYIVVNASRSVSAKKREVKLSFTLSKSARSLQLRCLPGGLPEIAQAYRERAEELGYRTHNMRRRMAQRLDGASNVKLWTALDRRIDENLVEKSVTVHWTFDEVAKIAEHLKTDLKMDDVLYHLGGWTRYGYDCKHPDNMPANPECGGNTGLKDCIKRVQKLGYLFCLHDNYQDMYRDAPSWDEAYIQKTQDGSLCVGGVWLGGRAYITCSREAVKLAKRAENLPLICNTFHPDLYFIDTTYAAGLQECSDPRHPLTKQDDLVWKAELSDYARSIFGMFGSECGREWAIPHADFFEGITSVCASLYHTLKLDEMGAFPVPFFDMVFRDCIAAYGKYGYKPEVAADLVLHHISIGRPLHYHSLGDHLYWLNDSADELPVPASGADLAVFTRAHNGWAEGMCAWDRYMKNTSEVIGPLHKLTAETLIADAQFMDIERKARRTVYANGVTVVVNGGETAITVQTLAGASVTLPQYGFLVESDTFVAFHATEWAGRIYDEPVLFTIASADETPLTTANSIRIYHGFGDARININGSEVIVQREETVTLNP